MTLSPRSGFEDGFARKGMNRTGWFAPTGLVFLLGPRQLGRCPRLESDAPVALGSFEQLRFLSRSRMVAAVRAGALGLLCGWLGWLPLLAQEIAPLPPIPPIERVLPPTTGLEIPPELRATLEERISQLDDEIWEQDQDPHIADAAVLVKAVDFAVRLGEFFKDKQFADAPALLDLAEERLAALEGEGPAPWLSQRGAVARGYQSRIDGSYQPYGLEIPEGLDLSRPVPLLVWLHGRGDTTTDLAFLKGSQTGGGALGGKIKDQQAAIVLHPFGRHCVGWKHAGEIDVFEAVEVVRRDYPIDPERIILAGFSMGGAGAWHLGAHYRDQFCAVHAGAGFVDTRIYQGLKPEQYPPIYEQTLWQLYDVPPYAENFRRQPLLAYYGSEDVKQQSAKLMADALGDLGESLDLVIGQGMGHKYDDPSVDTIWTWMQSAMQQGRSQPVREISWTTPTLRYGKSAWVQLTGLEQHWQFSKVSATWDADTKTAVIETNGVSAMELSLPETTMRSWGGCTLQINGAKLVVEDPGFPLTILSLKLDQGSWKWGEKAGLTKRPGVQGPIDDAFLSPFLVVGPGGPGEGELSHPKVARWVAFELQHFRDRWEALMRGKLPEKAAGEVNSTDIADSNLILWGDPVSNPLIAELLKGLPVDWNAERFVFRGKTYPTGEALPAFIFPNPLNPNRYVVINSGLTFREGHDRTNSLQNPKLPDWAVIGLGKLPDALAPGEVLDAGFFDESWK